LDGSSNAIADTFKLRLPSVDPRDLRVLSFRGREGVSRLYEWDIVVSTSAESLEAALGEAATLILRVEHGPPRVVEGIVARVRSHGGGTQRFTVRLVPRLWLLKRRRNTRIFQDQDIISVVKAVIGAWSIPVHFDINKKYPARSYCVQYDETDYGFITRLFAEEGFYFYFLQPAFSADPSDSYEEEQDARPASSCEAVIVADSAPRRSQ
jgi:type VI secretion system secreted protein VgrG